MNNKSTRAVIFALLALLMVVTRSKLQYHFMPIPDASWAVFFIAGFYLRGWGKWAFPSLMALAVVADYVAITKQGMDFFGHFCVSPAYWVLIAAYFALWMGGSLARRYYSANVGKSLAIVGLSLVTSAVVCQLLAQGSFYWVSNSVAAPTVSGWWQNYVQWQLPYLRTAAIYTGLACVVHFTVTALAGSAKAKQGA